MHLFSTIYEAVFLNYFILIFTCHLLHRILAQYPCSGTDTFVKVTGYIPSRENQLLLYSSPGRTVTKECYQRCRASTDCAGFLVNYTAYACYRIINPSEETTTVGSQYGYPYHGNISETNYFERTCLNGVPTKCRSKVWIFERAPNFELVGSNDVTYSAETRELCMRYCLQEARFTCRSAEYTYSSKKCVLSHQDRHTQTDSYRATPSGIDYLENQCIDPETGETCPFEEHKNKTLNYRDMEFPHLTQNECHDKCVNETNFVCRALTYLPDTASGTGISVCWLHSDDTISVGPRALKPLSGAIYMERVPCLDLMVICSERSINITLHTLEQFSGRIYVKEHSDTCDSKGTGGYTTTLIIPTSGSGSVNQCGVMVINSIGETNRTLMSTVIVIQHNPIIQRRGDRVVKIGCILDSKFSENVTVTAGLIVTGADTGEGTIYYNTTSSVPPTVRIYIIDPISGNPDIKETELGQNLEFRIEVTPDNGPFDIKAGHLVATSADGSESILLLDERGCPPDPATFPAFQKANPHSNSLVANFHAFKFPNSPVVRFRVMVQFCPGTCTPTNCGNGIIAYGRRKRETSINASLYQEMPLQTALVVHGPQLVPSSLLATSDNNGKIIVGIEDVQGSICVYYGAIIGLVIAWLLLQFLILIGCYMVVRERYKRKRDDDDSSMQHKLEDDFNGFDNSRHVHWADQLN